MPLVLSLTGLTHEGVKRLRSDYDMKGLYQVSGGLIAATLMFSLFVPVNASAHHGANTNPELYLAENLIEFDCVAEWENVE